MKAGIIALALCAALGEGALEIRNQAFTTCSESSDQACGKLTPATVAQTDFTESKTLLENAKACVKANEGNGKKCYAGVEARVVATGDHVCKTGGAGFFIPLDAGELAIKTSFQLNKKVPDANTGGTVNGKVLAGGNKDICTGAGQDTTYKVNADGTTIIASVSGQSHFIPGLPVQDKVTIVFSGEAGANKKAASPALALGVVAATAVIAASAW